MMDPTKQPGNGKPREAQDIYSEYLNGLREGLALDFEALCAEHPELEDGLRKLHSIVRLGQTLAASRSFLDSVREQFGDVSGITVSLEPESAPIVEKGSLPGERPEPDAVAFADERGRYRKEGEVARGGMAEIYRVRDCDLSRTLAMKVMLSRPGEESGPEPKVHLARFLEEAQLTAQLDHPGIVPVHEVGFDTQGRPFFTMKLVKGQELGEVFRLVRGEKEGWNLPRAVGVLVKVCQSIAYAHAKRVVHRDLKPSNIMVGRFGEVFVMDWGLAKVVGRKDLHDLRLDDSARGTRTSIHSLRGSAPEAGVESPLITMDGTVVGTPAYMSPEQAQGRVDDVESSSDVYGLGAILYNLLTGHPPYIEEDVLLSPHTILAAVAQGPPKPVHEAARAAPPELAAICEKAMAREKKNRYRSSLDMGEDLQAYLDGRVVKAFRTGAVAEFRYWVRRNRAVAAAAAIALVLALGGLVATTLVQERANVKIAQERDVARREHYYGSIALADRFIRNGQQDRALETLFSCAPEYRNWEWGYCLRRCNQAMLTFDQYGAWVEGMAFSPDGLRLAVRRSDGTLNLWSLETGDEILHVGGHAERVARITFSADNRWLATAGPGNAARIFDTKTGRESAPALAGHPARVLDVGFSPDSERLATAHKDDTTTIWDVAGRRLILTLSGPDNLLEVNFSPDGTRVITRGEKESRVSSAETGEALFTARIPSEQHTTRSLSLDGSMFAAAEPDGAVKLCDAETGGEVHLLRGPPGPILWLGFLSDGRDLGALGQDRSFWVWDPATGDKRGSLDARVRWADIARDFRVIVTSSGDRTAKLWDQSGEELKTFRGHTAIVENVLLSRDGRLAASADRDGTVKVWSTDIRRERLDAGSGVLALAVSPDGTRIATGHWDAQVRVWETETGRLLFSVKRYLQHVRAVEFSPNGRWVAAAGGDGIIDLFSAANGRTWLTLEGHPRLISCLAFSPDGTRIASGSNDTTVRLWNVETGAQLRTLEGHAPGWLTSVAFSPDGSRLVSGSWDETARVWDAGRGVQVRVLACSPDYVHTVAYSPDGRYVATAGEKTIRVWDAERWTLETSFDARSFVHALTWSPDGSRLVSVCGENEDGIGFPTLDVWDPVNQRELLTTLRAASGYYYCVAFAGDGRRLLVGGWGPTWESARLLEAFPYREEDYPGTPAEALRDRIERHAREYWLGRLEAEKRGADRGAETEIQLGVDRSRWPGRDPKAPPELVDLSKLYNALLTVPWYFLGGTYSDRHDLAELPRGLTTLANTPFDVRGVVQLAYEDMISRKRFPERVEGIEVNRRCRRLHLLHATVGSAREGDRVGRLALNYTDGAREKLEIIYGRDVRDWVWRPGAAGRAESAVIPWRGTNPYVERWKRGWSLRLFKSTFENPRPESEVRSIDFISALISTPQQAAPFLIALTVDDFENELDLYRKTNEGLVETFLKEPGEKSCHDLARSYEHLGDFARKRGNSRVAAAFYGLAVRLAGKLDGRLSRFASPSMSAYERLAYLEEDRGEKPWLHLVRRGSVWKYLDDGSAPGSASRTVAYDDSAWPGGPAPLGYGHGDEATIVRFGSDAAKKHVTTYFRRTFQVEDPAAIRHLLLRVQSDSGVVVHLNGEEVARDNLPRGEIGHETPAVEWKQTRWLVGRIPAALLRRGRNLLAAEVHRSRVSRFGMAFDMEIDAGTLDVDLGGIEGPLGDHGFAIPSQLRAELIRTGK